MNLGFVILGAIALLAGLVVLAIAIRTRGDGTDPRSNAMLIGGMMLTAFGLVLGGFAVAYSATEPLDLNSAGEVQ